MISDQDYEIDADTIAFTNNGVNVNPAISGANWEPTSALLSDGDPLPTSITFDNSTGEFTVFSNDLNFAGLYTIRYVTTAQAGILAGKTIY